jgi:anti-sigma factor RsiW
MTCQRVASENLIERYLQGSLDPTLRDEFEAHYFECDSCLAQIQTVQTIQPLLTAPPRRRSYLPWLGLAAAAAIAIALLSWPKPEPSPAPIVAVLSLAEVEPAPYAPTLFRDTATPNPAFVAAMRLYQDRQWPAAAQALAQLPEPAAKHFAGISLLLAGQTSQALAPLAAVIALGTQSPFEEEARFYRAQALLLADRRPEAKRELETIIQMRGDYEARARRLLSRL